MQLKDAEMTSRVSALVVGGENLLAKAIAFWQQNAAGTRIFNEYGPTETVVGCCVYEAQKSEDGVGSVPIGRPIANTQIYILDPHLQPLPIGSPGELFIAGIPLARGYLNRPELTAQRFLPDPFSTSPGSRIYRTGDRARYLSDGVIEYLGRLDEQVKIRGYRIELGEIEAMLRQHPSVSEAVVLAREDYEAERRLVAYLVLPAGEEANSAEVRSYLRQRLPEYMVPGSYVYLEEMPLSSNGKVERGRLPAPEEVEGGAGGAAGKSYEGARTPIEEMLVGLYAEVLHVERVSITDSFFDLGGHSLLATQLISRVRETFQVEVPLRALFEAPTVAGLAVILEESIIKEVEEISEEEAQKLLYRSSSSH
jgi:acyl-coenzyme A synthetase/AMP-(fatty) acid ligase/acyl carrier protein